jgi:hypothetical protein
MGKKMAVSLLVVGALAAILYRKRKTTTYYISKAELMRNELERKIAEKAQGN